MKRRLIIGISGASGSIYGVRILELLQTVDDVETHLVVSEAAQTVITAETDYDINRIRELADCTYDNADMAALIASGSYRTIGMIVVPCSIKTLSGIANSYSDSLMIRAADVTLKEGRTLALMVRESPLHKGHLKLMLKAADNGARIVPPVPYFYNQPQTIMDLVDQSAGRVLDIFDVRIPGLDFDWKGNDRPNVS